MAYTVAQTHRPVGQPLFDPPYNDVAEFVFRQWHQMPDYLRLPMMLLTLGYDVLGVLRNRKVYHLRELTARLDHLKNSKLSKLGLERDLVRYYESLGTLALFSRVNSATPRRDNSWVEANAHAFQPGELRCQYAVIGSGPSGALTACLLAEAGKDVLLIEEGPLLPPDEPEPFTAQEMLRKYRNGGQTVALGQDKIAYVEGKCVGGGSEINSGLYHRTPAEVLEKWRCEYKVEGLSETDLNPHFEACERDLCVSLLPHSAPPASLRLHAGATRLGWKSLEVPRWFRYGPGEQGTRQTMSRTYVPRFLQAGGRLITRARAEKLQRSDSSWELRLRGPGSLVALVRAEHIIICAGAVHTPALLRRSGISRNIGQTLALHPTAKFVAQFKEPVNADSMGVPVHQVKEFSPRLSFGCSISSMPYVALGLLDHPLDAPFTSELCAHMANYYAMVSPTGRGTVTVVPGFKDPLVRYRLDVEDRRNLADGMRKLGQLLLEAGATALFPSVRGIPAIRSHADLARIPEAFAPGTANLMTIHLFSSCPMGEDKDRCAVDSYGRVHGVEGLSIHDASLLCGPPGVNPQGTIMALARRNTLRLLGAS